MQFELKNITYSNVNNFNIDDAIRGHLSEKAQTYMLSVDFMRRRKKTYYEDRHHYEIQPQRSFLTFHIQDTITKDTVSGMIIPQYSA